MIFGFMDAKREKILMAIVGLRARVWRQSQQYHKGTIPSRGGTSQKLSKMYKDTQVFVSGRTVLC